jgi:hypothetical protein
MDNDVKDKTSLFVDVFREMGSGWHSRADLAKALNKNRLNPADCLLLDVMVSQGLLERSMAQTTSPTINRWLYRIKGTK